MDITWVHFGRLAIIIMWSIYLCPKLILIHFGQTKERKDSPSHRLDATQMHHVKEKSTPS